MSEERLNDDLAAIEAALCSLTPARSSIERDRLMFLAGKKAATSHRSAKLLWPMATAASLLAAATFGILWAAGNNPRLVERPAVVSIAGTPIPVDVLTDASPPSPWENRRLCQLMLEKGIDGLPQPSSHRVSGALPMPVDDTYRSLLRQFLDNPTGS
jgi:hypothetical protein